MSKIDPASTQVCEFCNELSGGSENSFARHYRSLLQERTILSTTNFCVVPSLGQIVEGYLLIVPRLHVRTFSIMPAELLAELSRLTDTVAEIMSHNYAPPLIFEHGTLNAQAGGCGIDHSHFHLSPMLVG